MPESVGDPNKTLPTSEKEENKRNEEREENKRNEGKRKRGRPSEKDKEGLPVSKKAKKSPNKKKNLKTGATNNNAKSKGYSKIFKKAVSTEKCIFCQEEHLRETFWEGVGQEKPEIIQIPICKRCHACLKDATVMNKIREAI